MLGYIIDNVIHHLIGFDNFQEKNSNFGEYKFIQTKQGLIRVLLHRGTGPCVLLASEPPNLISHYLPLIRILAEKRFTVLVVEFPGFGFSKPSLEYDYSLKEQSNMLHTIITEYNIEKCIIAFSSIAGLVAIQFASRYPDRVQAILISQTASLEQSKKWIKRMDPKSFLQKSVFGQCQLLSKRAVFTRLWYKRLSQNKQIKIDVQKSIAALEKGACLCFASMFQSLLNTKTIAVPSFGKCIPVGIIWGKIDSSHSETQMHSWKDILQFPLRVQFYEEWEDVAHFPDLEEPGRFCQAIDRLSKLNL